MSSFYFIGLLSALSIRIHGSLIREMLFSPHFAHLSPHGYTSKIDRLPFTGVLLIDINNAIIRLINLDFCACRQFEEYCGIICSQSTRFMNIIFFT